MCKLNFSKLSTTFPKKKLKEKKYKLAILSNGTPSLLNKLVSSNNLENIFDDVLSVEEVKTYKPHPNVYNIPIKKYQIEKNQFESSRKVIDVSGDGRSNNGIHPMSIRDVAIEKGITINGLVILNEEPFLGGYFERSVIGGYGAFMMVAEDYRDYAAMILLKLLT